uniref:Putative secreted protein n=1 Tax=Anopheles triannulatus TaxID=58253 RepID=A0A2M4B5E6_9DIPT
MVPALLLLVVLLEPVVLSCRSVPLLGGFVLRPGLLRPCSFYVAGCWCEVPHPEERVAALGRSKRKCLHQPKRG